MTTGHPAARTTAPCSTARHLARGRRRMLGVTVALVLVGTLAGGVLASAVPAGAQAAPADGQAVQVAIDLYRNRAKLEEAAAQVVDAQARLAAAEAALAETDSKIAITSARIAELQSELTGRAAAMYMERGGDLSDVLQIEHVQDLSVGTHYTNSAAADSNDKLAVLARAQRDLEQLRADQALARNAIADQKAQYDAVFADLQAASARDAALLARLGAIPVMGDSQLTGPQLAAWFRSIRGQARIADGTTIDHLAQMFIEEGAAEHLRGDIAFAQTMVETGSLSQTRGNNFSGIGNCDSCGGVGMMFPTSRDGVRADPTFATTRIRGAVPPSLRTRRLPRCTGPTRAPRRGATTRSSPRAARRSGT